MNKKSTGICPKCERKVGHPGPCPNCSNHSGEMIQSAIDLANLIHHGQYRKGSCKPPYIVHCIGVLNKLLKWGIEDPFVLSASVLHDTLEDSVNIPSGELKEIIKRSFGPLVLNYVEELTFCSEKETKAEYLSSFKDKSDGALIVKLADRIYNTEDFCFNCKDFEYGAKYLIKAGTLFDVFYNKVLEERFEIIRGNIEKDISSVSELVAYKN